MLLLEGCNVNDATVQVLARSCPLLHEVSIKGSMGCSDKSANVLLEVCTRLCFRCFRHWHALLQQQLSRTLTRPCALSALPAVAQTGHAQLRRHHEGQSHRLTSRTSALAAARSSASFSRAIFLRISRVMNACSFDVGWQGVRKLQHWGAQPSASA